MSGCLPSVGARRGPALRGAACIVGLALLAGCGQKGALIAPRAPAPTPAASSPPASPFPAPGR